LLIEATVDTAVERPAEMAAEVLREIPPPEAETLVDATTPELENDKETEPVTAHILKTRLFVLSAITTVGPVVVEPP